MKLKKILLEMLQEQEQDSEDVIEFPSNNMVLSVDKNKKKLILTPLNLSSNSSTIRKIILMLKQNFKISKINALEDDDSRVNKTYDSSLKNTFEIQVDPTENLDSVVEFVKNEANIKK